MKRILGTLVVVALVLGSSSVLAAAAPTHKAAEMKQVADGATDGPAFIRTAMELLLKAQAALQSIISSREGLDPEKPWVEETSIDPAIVKNVGGSE